MAPLKPVRKDGYNERLQRVIDGARSIELSLKERKHLTPGFRVDLDSLISSSFSIHHPTSSHGKASDLDSLGVGIWNAAMNLRDDESEDEDDSLETDGEDCIVLLRVLAFSLIDSAFFASKRESDRNHDRRSRALKIGLKASRFCLDINELELGLKVLERCSNHVSYVENNLPSLPMTETVDERYSRNSLNLYIAEFYLVRAAHSWKSDRLDLTEHFYSKIPSDRFAAFPGLVEEAADLFYEIGKALNRKGLVEPSITWQERALRCLEAYGSEKLAIEIDELRLTITVTLVTTLLSRNLPDCETRARKLIDDLEHIYSLGERMAVQLMQFNIALKQKPVDIEHLSNLLIRMSRSMVLTELNFKLIMQKFHMIRYIHVEAALRGLDELIVTRLLPNMSADEQAENNFQLWIEKAVVTYTLFATTTSSCSHESAIQGVRSLSDALVRACCGLSSKATHAAQTLIWKGAGTPDVDAAQDWLLLLQHPLFDKVGVTNKAKTGRKLISVAMAKGDFETAKEAFFQMPLIAQNEDKSRYLAFKLAICLGDFDLARDSLDVITSHSGSEPRFLYACVLEAQRSTMRTVAVAALQSLLDRQSPGVYMPSLLRCTVRLLISELDTKKVKTGKIVEEILSIFEHAASSVDVMRQGGDDQWRDEIQWWGKNAYNLSFRLCEDMRPEHLVRLLSTCTRFLDEYAGHANLETKEEELSHRRSLCHFLAASSLIVLARSSQQNSEDRIKYYSRAREEIAAFHFISPHCSSKTNPESAHKYDHRALELYRFDLECILHLKQWDAIDATLRACLSFHHIESWDALADILLQIHAYAARPVMSASSAGLLSDLLDKIVMETWHVQNGGVDKAARWLRLTFSLDLEDGQDELALRLLSKAAIMARDAAASRLSASPSDTAVAAFPEDELQYLSSVSFNKAVELLNKYLFSPNDGSARPGIAAADGMRNNVAAAARRSPPSAGQEAQGLTDKPLPPHPYESAHAKANADEWISASLELARYAADDGALHARLTKKAEFLRGRVRELEGRNEHVNTPLC